MKIVRTFATSANVGPGFDTLGICFDLYNEYEYSISSKYIIKEFKEKYCNPNRNLIIKSYEEVFKRLNKELIYITLKQVKQDIPTSRGLGSSASCIVTGILIANDILGNPLSKDEIFQIASDIEGHPDNVAPLIYGGFTCSFKEEEYKKISLNINSKYKFMVCIPPFELSTAKAREVLPKTVSMSDSVFNVSHSIAMIKALETGDMELLKLGKKDKLHEPFRYPLINESEKVVEYANKNNAVCLISGAGSTLLLISDKKLINLPKLNDWVYKEVNVSNIGAYIYEK